ncbi:HalOD1 output domain-containing protein [Halobaculum lipolyticum]|uniref:HalOD1 output domain-containing protein n=1 Tax=Halobaculum lipolyticum TaxID=3032001 RepID=A0ABD5WAP4_9EURY|nr:HalOD1 output domain-containing protein [Halobaculum sp. DT31]
MSDVLDLEQPVLGGRTVRSDPSRVAAVTTAVVEATAAAVDADPLDLTPLTDAIDPDALETLVGSAESAAEIRFTYNGCRVTVGDDGGVVVTAP